MAKLNLSQVGHSLFAIAIIAIVYYLSARFALSITLLNHCALASVLYPPIGISLAAILLIEHPVWLGVFSGAVMSGRSLDQVNWLTAFLAATGNTLEVIVASQLLKQVEFSRLLRRVRDVLALIGCGAVLAPTLNATITTLTSAAISQPTELMNHWFASWLDSSVSILVFTPAIVVWGNQELRVPHSFRNRLKKLQPVLVGQRTIEFYIWLGLMGVWNGLMLTTSTGTAPIVQGAALLLLKYSPFLFVVWAALRFGQQRTMLCFLIASLSSIWGLTQIQQGNFQSSLFQIQIAIAIMAIITLVLVATIAERKTVEAQLRRRIEQDQFLAESTLRIRQSLDVKQVLNTTVAEVRAYLNADRAHIAVFDEQGFTDVVAESVAPGWNPMLGTRSPRPILADIAVLFEQQSVRVNPNSDMTQNEFLKLYYAMYQVKASIGIAIWQEGRLYGVLNVHQCVAPRNWQDFEIELLTRLATQVELAIQQGRLYEKVQGFASGLESQVQERTAQLQQKMIELETLNQVKDTLVHAVSHDLRTPVLGMLMVLKRLQTKAEETISLSKSVLDRMVESGDRQLSLISSLLENYSQEPHKLSLNYQRVSIVELVDQTLHRLEPLIHQNQIRLEKQIAPDVPQFLADSIQLQRVLEHLITNAMNHNLPGINLAIQVEKIENEMKCTISDDGIGIPPDQCNLLFDKPFLRGSQNHHRTGLGLGLFLCKQVITAHQGQIGVNCGGKGANFWFTLPLQ